MNVGENENIAEYFNEENCPAINEVISFDVERFAAHISSIVNLDGADVLSLCCGDGRLEKVLLKRFRPKSLTCLDLSEKNLNTARKNLPPNVRFVCMDLNNFRRELLTEYDIIFTASAAQYFKSPELKKLHKNLFSCIQAGGKLFHFNVPDGRRKFLYRLNNVLIMKDIKYLLPRFDFIDKFSHWCDRKDFYDAEYSVKFITPSHNFERFDVCMEKIFR